ncbi:efflux RND transporter periplasmic adaptor subunit [Undibacterium sp. TC4M20W]|uniref:efflux RND transporter periplasmic adaptor subunit n=1 Tax=Undibacterium sp. TC4M20W TaxID=3413052 RepID=UPI003BF15AB1
MTDSPPPTSAQEPSAVPLAPPSPTQVAPATLPVTPVAPTSGTSPVPPATAPPAPATKPKTKLKRYLIIAGVNLVVIALLVWAFKPKPLSVEVAKVTQGRFERAIQEYGKTRVRNRYIVSTPLAGRVGRVLLNQGDSVTQGDTVALLWPMAPALLDERARDEQSARIASVAASLARTQANVGHANAALVQAQADLRRSEALARQGFVSPNQNETGRLNLSLRIHELETARQEENAARHDLEQSRAALKQFAQAPLGGSQPSFAIKAPVSGKVLKILQQSETSVAAGAGLLELGDPTKLEVVVDLLTEDATQVRPGTAVQLLNWGGAEVLSSKVRWVEPAAFTKVSALGVEEQRVYVVIDIIAPAAQWQALGDAFKVDVRVLVQVVENAIIVPVSALFPIGSRSGVFVVEKNHAVLKEVSVEARNGVSAWVKEGLPVGTQVIVYPDSKLKDKAAVKVR